MKLNFQVECRNEAFRVGETGEEQEKDVLVIRRHVRKYKKNCTFQRVMKHVSI